MKKLILGILLMFSVSKIWSQAISQKRQHIKYASTLTSNGIQEKSGMIAVLVNILTGNANGPVIYTETHLIRTDSTGGFQIEIGAGKQISGQYDSIIWSDGIFYLKTSIDPKGGNNYSIVKNMIIRIPPELSNDYDQGTVSSVDHPDWGEWRYKNTRNKRPKLVTIDLSTTYANLAYPANTYPVYRHYEWCDPDRDGSGNSFCVSFSENISNNFIENTTKLGDVRLYAIPFQELNISSNGNEIIVTISKPVPVTNLGETYAIKGPWKFIYYIEW